MTIKRVEKKILKILKILLYVNTFILLALGSYYLFFHIINSNPNNVFDTFIFLPLLLAFIGSEVMLMSYVYNNSSYKSNNTQDNAMFNLGLIIEGLAVVTLIVLLIFNLAFNK